MAFSDLKFSSTKDALQYLSDYTQYRVVVAQEIEGLDIAKFIDQVKAMSDVKIDDFVDDIEDLIKVSQDEADARKNSDNPVEAELLMAALLQAISKRAQEYRDDLKNMDAEDINDISKKFKRDLEDLVDRYHKGQVEIIDQQEAAAETTADIST